MDTALDFTGAALDVSVRLAGPSVHRPSEAHIYVLGYDSGTVKVGHSRRPAERVGSHVSEAGRHGLAVTRAWVSGPHIEADRNEGALIKTCVSRCSGRSGREYFAGLNVEDVIAVAQSLPATRDPRGPSPRAGGRLRDAEFMRRLRSGEYVVLHGAAYDEYVLVAAAADEALFLFRKLFTTRYGRLELPSDVPAMLRQAADYLERRPYMQLEWQLAYNRANELPRSVSAKLPVEVVVYNGSSTEELVLPPPRRGSPRREGDDIAVTYDASERL